MVTKRIRSEYMKKFKDPKWETYSKCYEEMLRYRLTRRLLEHTHNPWFWSGSDTDSDSTGRSPPPPSPPPPPSKNQVGDEVVERVMEAELEQCEPAITDRDPELVPRIQLQEDEGVAAAKDAGQQRPQQQTKAPKSTKHPRRPPRVRPAPSRQSKQEVKGSRHSFALYGSGEKDANVGSRKTHNVGPLASTDEIHESALRAKTRREAERQIQTQRAERRRAKSADQGKNRKVVQPEFNPWITEYMRCFSVRSR